MTMQCLLWQGKASTLNHTQIEYLNSHVGILLHIIIDEPHCPRYGAAGVSILKPLSLHTYERERERDWLINNFWSAQLSTMWVYHAREFHHLVMRIGTNVASEIVSEQLGRHAIKVMVSRFWHLWHCLSFKCLRIIGVFIVPRFFVAERGEQAASYWWTGWSSRLHPSYQSS